MKKNENTATKTRSNRKISMILLGSTFIFIGLCLLIYWFIWGQFKEYTDNAYVTGNIVQLMPQVNGTIVEINTDETQLVKEGQILIRLDPADYAIALQRAKADLEQTVRQVRQYFENARQAQQKVSLDRANLVKAELDLKRRLNLVGNRAVSRESMQHYKTAVEAARASYNISLRQLDTALALVNHLNLYNHPLVEVAKTNVKNAYLNYKRTSILAPISGYIAKRNIQLGQQVSMSTVMLAIIPLQDTWVNANYKESSLVNIRMKQPVILYADAYPDLTYHGKVVGLNAGTGAAFSILPPQNATGNWIKIVQRLPVRIQIDKNELTKNPLQLGLSLRATIDTHDRRGGRMPTVVETITNETSAYASQLAEVNELINKILKESSQNIASIKAASA